ncbi:hypothetical protein BU26DRAFT_606059 [Trematosphaeria pertusa]|uniref:Uncharacterized protein n=1 Tax=Trematosphaeria pertusa TaxID=390896 RepID=A0A6A6I8X4_9PLEO|nr:uncharacterized protein BU26DRAFT_606059 [Trematosphaeria pertusa]KAF2247014.1 hypothetical protein BU26DRAFT_606059 [Trematosphaeria pertusa]
MGALLSTARSLLNLLLPFTNPNTPVIQDLIHTAVLCGTLYYAPQIAEYYNVCRNPPVYIDDTQQTGSEQDNAALGNPPDDIPIDENLVLQPDTDDGEEVEPPPLAPTPPPGQARAPPAEPAVWGGVNGDDQPQFAEAGPANADRPRPTPANRVVGAKKAKSLARKDQRRAYHEFHRQEAELRRLREAEGREEREAALQAEKARRAEVEREIAEREKSERERKKEEERREQEEERERRDRVVQRVRREVGGKGAVDLVDLAWEEGKDKVWIEKLIRASGMLSQVEKAGSHTMITGDGWLVRIDAVLMQKAYADAVAFGDSNEGKVSFSELGGILEKAVRARVKALAH